MDSTIFLLLAANIGIPVIATYATCVSDGLEINHVAVFTFGYLYYWILPIALGALDIFRTNSAMRPFYDLFDQVSVSSFHIYLTISLCSYLFFLLGHFLSRNLRWRSLERYAEFSFDRRLLALYLLLGTAVCVTLAYQLKGQLFQGYMVTEDVWHDPLRGTYAGAANFLVCVAVIYITTIQTDHTRIYSFSRVFMNPYLIAAFLALIINLSLGQRSYVLSAIVMVAIYRSVFFKHLRFYTAVLSFLIGLSAAGAFALVRQRNNLPLLAIICAEPLFTSISLVYFLRELTLPLIRWPALLFRDLLFLVPTVLLPNKLELIPNVTDAGIPLFSPLGAQNSFLAFVANFGVVGTFGAFLLLGFGVNLIRSGARVPLLRVIYVILSAQLAFTLWRDDFAYSLVKNILEGAFAIPVLIFATLNLLTGLLRRRSEAASGRLSITLGS